MFSKPAAAIATLLVAATLPMAAFAQAYPSKPIHVVIAYNPGGTADATGRLVADMLRDGFKTTVVTENRGGASGAIGTSHVKAAAPDGYTLLVHTNSLTLQPATVVKPVYDPVKDLTPIAMLTSVPVVIVVPKDSPLKTLGDLVRVAKENPGKLNMGHGGFGTYGWYAMTRFMLDAGFKLTDVPYTSAGAVQTAVLGGQLDLAIDSPAGVGKFVRDGSMRALASSSEERTWHLPEVPTGKEQGLPFRGLAWVGILAPAGTDRSTVNLIFDQIRLAVARPEIKDRAKKIGMDITLQDPTTFARTVAEDFSNTKEIITTQKIPLQ
jgi:tripartite-type tricarboxylate transporter receptor subunit TctC